MKINLVYVALLIGLLGGFLMWLDAYLHCDGWCITNWYGYIGQVLFYTVIVLGIVRGIYSLRFWLFPKK